MPNSHAITPVKVVQRAVAIRDQPSIALTMGQALKAVEISLAAEQHADYLDLLNGKFNSIISLLDEIRHALVATSNQG